MFQILSVCIKLIFHIFLIFVSILNNLFCLYDIYLFDLPWLPFNRRWSGQAIVLGKFQCRGVQLIYRIVGQGPIVLDVRVSGRFIYFYIYINLSPIESLFSLCPCGRQVIITIPLALNWQFYWFILFFED